MLKEILILGIILTFTSFAHAQQQESITITTYYPSPYGSYNELQLYPHSEPVTTCDNNTKGTMYYDGSQIKICNGTNWVSGGIVTGGLYGWCEEIVEYATTGNRFPRECSAVSPATCVPELVTGYPIINRCQCPSGFTKRYLGHYHGFIEYSLVYSIPEYFLCSRD